MIEWYQVIGILIVCLGCINIIAGFALVTL